MITLDVESMRFLQCVSKALTEKSEPRQVEVFQRIRMWKNIDSCMDKVD